MNEFFPAREVTASGVRTRALSLILSAAIILGACGDGERGLVGYRAEPVPQVDSTALPDLTNGGADFTMRAAAGGILLVYFGYTNCPDFCPATLTNVCLARKRLDEPGRIQVAMVTVDPHRDLPVLADYVAGFVPDGHALGTDNAELLAAAASPFGVSSEVATGENGSVEVPHTTYLYAVDDAGRLVLVWPFGVSSDDIAGDLEQLLDES